MTQPGPFHMGDAVRRSLASTRHIYTRPVLDRPDATVDELRTALEGADAALGAWADEEGIGGR